MKKSHILLALLALGVSASPLAACSSSTDSDGTGGSDGSEDKQFPSDTTPEGIKAFLAEEAYQEWTGDDAIREGSDPVNPHGENLRVYFNDVALVSKENDNASPMERAMAVKEIYNEAGSLLGHAVSLKDDDGKWVYYCDEGEEGSGILCSGLTEDYPVTGERTSCSYCHGDLFFAPLP